jgi:hypothetical protein
MTRASAWRLVAAATVCSLALAACSTGTTLVARNVTPAGALPTTAATGGVLGHGRSSENLGTAPVLNANGGDPKCATNSDPAEGFTASTMTWGTIIPLTGTLRPLGEQTIRAMQASISLLNRTAQLTSVAPNWGCSTRPGIFGRTIQLKIFSLQANTPEEALAGMRRLIDVDHSFLVRDCYLESNLMGPATQYQNSEQVPTVWCFFSSLPQPALAPWDFAPGTSTNAAVAIHVGNLITKLGRKRIAILADPSVKDNLVAVVQRVAAYLGHPIPDGCIAYTQAQDTSQGMRAQITKIRACYGSGTSPDAVMALDALNATFGALEAKDENWRGADNNVQWDCSGTSCWVTTLAQLCGDACQGMLTDCATLPCVPWADPNKYPAISFFRQWRAAGGLTGDPEDILTYAPIAITAGIALWLWATGPNLSRARFADTLQNLHNFDSGIGPILNTTPGNHFGGRSIWLIQYSGGAPWFNDWSHGFLTMDDVGVPDSLAVG